MNKLINKLRSTLAAMLLVSTFFACDEDTLGVGTTLMPEDDAVTTKTASFVVKSYTEKADSVLANTNTCLIGRIIDPETRAMTTCDFLAQFHVMENYAFPAEDMMVKDADGIVVDSCDLRIYFETFYGDSLTPMILKIHELDTLKVMEENTDYYTNINPADYINERSNIKDSLVYTVRDMTRDTLSETSSSAYYRSIKVKLPKSYGKFLVDKYYENPLNYKNSYNFIRNVCAGFYFESAGGIGSMINVKVSALNVYFRYHSKTELGNDTIVDGMQRMGATEEVLQNTRISNALPGDMLNPANAYTYVKSPAALRTVVELPIEEIYNASNQSSGDSVNSARLSFRRFNPEVETAYSLPAPQTLLMVRKSEMKDFFKKEKITNDRDSYVTDFNSSKNAYVFENIADLVKLCYADKDKGDPDWNKVVLVPVTTEYSVTTNSYGQSVRTLLKVRNDLSLSSARLEGGNSEDLRITVVYSKFGKE